MNLLLHAVKASRIALRSMELTTEERQQTLDHLDAKESACEIMQKSIEELFQKVEKNSWSNEGSPFSKPHIDVDDDRDREIRLLDDKITMQQRNLTEHTRMMQQHTIQLQELFHAVLAPNESLDLRIAALERAGVSAGQSQSVEPRVAALEQIQKTTTAALEQILQRAASLPASHSAESDLPSRPSE